MRWRLKRALNGDEGAMCRREQARRDREDRGDGSCRNRGVRTAILAVIGRP